MSLPELFEVRAAEFADFPAISGPAGVLTYAQLNAAADALAQNLAASGAGGGETPETVALLMDHDSPQAAALLGILKAGHVAMPLDPDDPPAFLRNLLESAKARFLVTDPARERVLAEANDIPPGLTIVTAAPGSPAPGTPAAAPLARCSPSDPASPCIIVHAFTSPAVPLPKGVISTHRSLITSARNLAESSGLKREDRVALLARGHLSAGLTTMLSALLHGACLLPFDVKSRGLHELKPWLASEKITVYQSSPSVFRRLCESLTSEDRFPDLRLVKLGGEPLLNYDIKLLQRHFPDTCRLINALEMTEASGDLCHARFDHETSATFQTLPVGPALPGVEILLLDEQGMPVPEGETGELAFRGPLLTPGYRHSNEFQERLVPAPPGHEGAPFLRTGDFARYAPGTGYLLEQRQDGQFKMRGLRIHPHAIESLLREHPGVEECAVGAWGSGSQEKRLVAWWVARPGEPLSANDLRAHLAPVLPDAMIPSVFKSLDQLPLNADGQIATATLPDPFASAVEEHANPADRPADGVELQLARIWRKILRRKNIRMTENFFEIGGDSLLAAVLLSRIEAAFGMDFPLEELMAEPTIRGISETIRSSPTHREFAHLLKIVDGPEPAIFWVPGAGIHAAASRGVSKTLPTGVRAMYCLRHPGIDGVELPIKTVEEHAAHFIKHLRLLQPEGPYYLGGGSFGGRVAFEAARQLVRQNQRVDILLIEDTHLEESLVPRTDISFPKKIRRLLRPLMPLGKRDEVNWEGFREGLRQLRYRATVPWKRFLCRRREEPLPKIYRFHDVLNASIQAGNTYRPERYEGRTVLFRNLDKGSLHDWYHVDPTLGWGEFCPHLEIVDLEGRHGEQYRDEELNSLHQEKIDAILAPNEASPLVGSADLSSIDPSLASPPARRADRCPALGGY